MRMRSERWDLAAAGFLAVASVLYVCWRWGITLGNLSLPFVYMGWDDFETYVDVTNIRDTGWLWHSARLGAPFGAEFHDFPVIFLHNFDELLFKAVLVFVPDVFETVNVVFLLTPVLSCWTSYFVLRELGVSRLAGMGGALTFAFLPFYFLRNEFHMMLTLFSFAPLVFWLCVFAYRGMVLQSLRLRSWGWRDWLALVFCVLIANNGTAYYQAFACFFLLVTALLTAADRHDWRAGLPALRVLGVVLLVFLLCLLPMVQQNHLQGPNLEPAQRNAVEVDRGGLRLTAMLLPRELPLRWADKKVDAYHQDALSDGATYIGPLASVGVMVLLVVPLFRRKRDDVMGLFGRLGLAALLLTMVGGLASLGSVFLAPGVLLRVYYRMSLYLAFMGLWLVCAYLDRWCAGHRYGMALRVGVAALFACNLFAQYPHGDARDYFVPKEVLPSFSPPDFTRIRAEFTSDREFVQGLEASLPAGAMIYQLPYHKFPEAGTVERMYDYQLFTGFLHSRQLRWSYGGMKGRPGDAWQQEVAKLSVPELVPVLRSVGFAGIYVDRRAYTEDAFQGLCTELSVAAGSGPSVSRNGNLVFFSLQ